MLFAPDPAGPQTGLPGADKLVHAALFALLTVTGSAAARSRPVAARALLPALVAYAVLSEVVQDRLLPARSGDVLDVVADLTGVALGVLLPAARARYGRSPRSGA